MNDPDAWRLPRCKTCTNATKVCAENADEQFTFIPKINDKSNAIANATNLDELASSKSNDLEREAAKQIARNGDVEVNARLAHT